jgi:hypothetical protein
MKASISPHDIWTQANFFKKDCATNYEEQISKKCKTVHQTLTKPLP